MRPKRCETSNGSNGRTGATGATGVTGATVSMEGAVVTAACPASVPPFPPLLPLQACSYGHLVQQAVGRLADVVLILVHLRFAWAGQSRRLTKRLCESLLFVVAVIVLLVHLATLLAFLTRAGSLGFWWRVVVVVLDHLWRNAAREAFDDATSADRLGRKLLLWRTEVALAHLEG